MKAWKLFSVALALLLLAITLPSSQAQGAITQIQITDIDHTSYPQVNVQLSAANENGRPVTGLSPSSFEVTEDGIAQTVSVSTTEGGVYVHFVIDAGPAIRTGDRWLKAQNAILSFVATDPRMGDEDIVEVSVLEPAGSRQIVPPTNNRENIVQAISNYSPPTSGDINSYRADLPFIGSWVDSLVANRYVEGRPTIVVVLTANFGLFNAAQVSNIAAKAKASAAPIYTLLVRDQANNESSAVATLATESGGEYFHLQNNTQLVPAYDSIETYRHQYVLSYDSQGSLSGTRRVQVKSGSEAEATAQYEIQLQPPLVAIVSPIQGQIIPRISEEFVPEDQLSLIEPTEHIVRATVEFPDGYPRRLNNASLLVNGSVMNTTTNVREMEFVWDLREGQQVGSTTYQLAVSVEDVLGLVSTTEIRVAVNVNNQEVVDNVNATRMAAQATLQAEEWAVSDATRDAQATRQAEIQVTREAEIQATLSAVPTAIPCSLTEGLQSHWPCETEIFVRGNWFGFIGIAIAVGSVAFVGMSKSAPAQNIRNTVRHAVERVTNRYRKQAVRAYLFVEDGEPTLVGQNLEIYGDTPIGRSLEVAHLLFHQTQPNTPISRLHCTLLDKEDHFEVQDEDSANGTFVNDRRLQPLEPYTLEDGDTIDLAPIARGGVRLRFQLALDGHADMTDEQRLTKRTVSASGSNNGDGDVFG